MFKSAALVLLSRSSHSFLNNFKPRRSINLCFTHKMSTQVDVLSTKNDVISPPVARREEDNVCFAGVGPSGWDVNMPRQSNDSSGEHHKTINFTYISTIMHWHSHIFYPHHNNQNNFLIHQSPSLIRMAGCVMISARTKKF